MIIFVAGLAKGGTTTLESLLRKHARHPVKNKNKEPGWFYSGSANVMCTRNNINLRRQVIWETPPFSNEYLYIDASPHYLSRYMIKGFIESLGRLDSEGIEYKVIICLRDPIDRAYSHYFHHVRDGLENLSFEEAVSDEVVDKRRKLGYWLGYDYLNESKFVDALQQLQSNILPQNLLIINQQDIGDEKALISKLTNFLPSRWFKEIEENKKLEQLNRTGKPVGLISKIVLSLVNFGAMAEPLVRKNELLFSISKKVKGFVVSKIRIEKLPLDQELSNKISELFVEEKNFLQRFNRDLD